MDNKSQAAALNRLLVSRLRLRHLALLSLLAQHRRVSRVADLMRMGQPAITRALKEVEDIFSAELFERAPGGLRPTEAGEAVLKYAEAALSDLSMTSQKLVAIAAGVHGRIRLGIIPHAPEALVSAAMQQLLSQNPRISIVVREGLTADLVGALHAHELDCAIGRTLDNEDADIVQEPIFEQSPGILVGSRVFDRIAERSLDWKLLAELDWILQPPNTPMRHMVDAIFAGAGVPPPLPVVETFSIRVIESSLRLLNSGITILARDFSRRLTDSGVCRLLPYELNWKLPPICLLRPKAFAQEPVVEALAVAVRDAAKQLALDRQISQSANF